MARVWQHYAYTMASVWHFLGKGLERVWGKLEKGQGDCGSAPVMRKLFEKKHQNRCGE